MGGIIGMMGAIQEGNAQQQAYESQAQANEYNATIQKNNAISASQEASAQEDLQRRQYAIIQGEANAGIAQSGTGFGGSNADILKQNAINAELDALNIRYQGQNKSRGLMAQSALSTFNASQNRVNGANAVTAYQWKAAGIGMNGLMSGLAGGMSGGSGASLLAGG